MTHWHRLFGLVLWDYFLDSPYEVELEKDLSLKRQLLDVVILHKCGEGDLKELPDGLENLKIHNLLTYKSMREPLDDWSLHELIGHYVNYRKQVSPSLDTLLPEEDFQLYGVCTRFPQKLVTQNELVSIRNGVYDLNWGSRLIRVIVLSEMENAEQNAIWNLFSANAERVRYGADHYQMHSSNISTIINRLFETYNLEGIMPYTIEDFQKEYVLDHLSLLSPEDRLRGLPPEDRLKGLPPEERLKGLPPEDRLRGLSLEELKAWLKKLESQKK
ncbi:MAG: hypothetical protein HQM11_03065 [SAR324 cluster bacterium]|nr:hypothetical protein [SAR324 cluster bacterium]